MAILSRAQIEAANDLPYEEVEVPEWGGSVRLRPMTAGEHARLGSDYESLSKEQIACYVLAKTIVDEEGKPLFADEAGLEALTRKSGNAVLRLAKVADRINKLGDAQVEAAAKN